MKLILRCWSSDTEYYGNCDLAYLDLTPKLAELLLLRINLLRKLKENDPSLIEMYYMDYYVDYFSRECLEKTTPNQDADVLDNLFDELESGLDAGDNITTAPIYVTSLADHIQWARAECDQVVVRDDAVCFYTNPKHSGVQITTGDVTVELLEKVLAGEAAHSA